MITAIILLLSQLFLSACASNVHTGFNYGAFWSTVDKPKHKAEYVKAFQTAYALNTPVAFDSARLFTCRQPGTTDKWIEAFDAAVETHTYLLLGFYVSEVRESARKPGQTYETNEQMLHNELKALNSALAKYENKLADLIIGLSVGNEDMEQWYAGRETGVPEKVIAENIETVRGVVKGSSAFGDTYPAISKYLKNIPIGHTDTAPHAAKVKEVDFVGMNAYPYWSGDAPSVMKESYFGSLENIKKGIPGKEIWLTEVGWPFKDTTSAKAASGTAGKQNLQKYWNEIGCEIFGKYTTFWFELTQDTLADQPDWAILDSVEPNTAPRIDVSCGKGRSTWANGQNVPEPEAPASQLSETAPTHESDPKPSNRSTVHVTITSTITETLQPGSATSPNQAGNLTTAEPTAVNVNAYPTPSSLPSNTPIIPSAPPDSSTPPRPTVYVTEPTGCITIFQDANGQPITISNPPVDGKCPTPTYVPPSNANVTIAQPTHNTMLSQSAIPAPNSTLTVIEATGCITVSDDGNGGFVTVASNLPMNGTCPVPTYVPPKSSKVRITVIVSPSPVTGSGGEVVAATVSGLPSFSLLHPLTTKNAVLASSTSAIVPDSSATPRGASEQKRHAEPLRSFFCGNGHC